MSTILDTINYPADLRHLSKEELRQVADEIRQYIITTLSSHPGHLASSLGTVELTVALHYVFNTPDDKLVWDVGHQAYAHKIVTGRREQFPTIRTYGGLSGFPRMDESEYDAFGTGHSSTSISAALGMAVASSLQGNSERQHIAVIGDGSMTGGEAFEALNNAGVSKSNILVVLNDNGISIDKAVGGLNRNLTRITASRRYNELKERVWRSLGGDTERGRTCRRVTPFRYLAFLAKTAMLGEANLFEALGFRYFGPIDGHDIGELVETLNKLRAIKGPRLLHIVTKKGKGLREAERNPVIYHAPGRFDATTGQRDVATSVDHPKRYQDVFGEAIIELARQNDKIVAITPAMLTGSSLTEMKKQMPERTFDVGIAEQHAVTFSAGLAAQGMVPFCNIYSSFMQRAIDQVIHDVALQHLPVVMCLDRAGLVGDDGATHHGVFDIAYLRYVPGLTICAPLNENELRSMMFTAQLPGQGPWVIRYPRGEVVANAEWNTTPHEMKAMQVGRGRQLCDGSDVAIVAIGHVGNDAMAAASVLKQQGISAAVYDMRFVKPLDSSILDAIASRGFRRVVTVEDGVRQGGFGSAVAEYFVEKGYQCDIRILGVPDHFVPHGPIPQLHKDCGIDVDSIIMACNEKR